MVDLIPVLKNCGIHASFHVCEKVEIPKSTNQSLDIHRDFPVGFFNHGNQEFPRLVKIFQEFPGLCKNPVLLHINPETEKNSDKKCNR